MKFRLILAAGALFGIAGSASAQELKDAPEKDVVMKVCGDCHTIDTITNKRMSRDDWDAKVQQMIGYGAVGTPTEIKKVVEYLATYYNITPAPAAAAKKP